MRARDWAATPLGPPDAWPQSLRATLQLVLNARYPMQVWWGQHRFCFQNEVFCRSFELESGSSGDPVDVVANEFWRIIGPQIEKVMSSGEAIQDDNASVPVTRKTGPEEAYWNRNFVPIDEPSAPNGIGGVVVAWVETTALVLRERQRDAERRRQRRLLEEMPGLIMLLRGPDHIYEFINDTHHRLFGSEDWLGKPIREAFPEIAGQGFLERLDQVYRTGEQMVLHDAPIRFHRDPGTAEDEHFLDFVYAPVTDPTGADITGIFCQGFDVTDAHIAKEKLRESEHQLQSILDTVPDAMIVTDEDGVILSFSPAAETLYQWSKAEVVGQSFLMLAPASDREALDSEMERFADSGESRTLGVSRTVTGLRKDGSTFLLELFVGETSSNGRRLFIGFVRSLTERLAAETRLHQMQAELAHVSRLSAMGEMAAGLAHELN